MPCWAMCSDVYKRQECDRRGLLVFTELPGWQHIGDDNWKDAACEMLQEMLLQNRNHPSIILWGVRINESVDDDAFYTRTNKIAHQLDPSRATSGVRYLEKSHLLEDVYAYKMCIRDSNIPIKAIILYLYILGCFWDNAFDIFTITAIIGIINTPITPNKIPVATTLILFFFNSLNIKRTSFVFDTLILK